MRSRGTLILAIITAALAAWYFFVQKPRTESERERTEASRSLASFGMDDVTRIEIERRGEVLALEIRATHWHMTRPFDDLAEPGSVGRLLKAIVTASIARNLGPQDDLERFGLEPPACVITLGNEAGALLRLEVGGYTVDHGSAYARRDGDVLLIPTGVRRYALESTEDFRNRRVLNFDLSVVTAYTLEEGDRSMRWVRHGGRWVTVADGDSIRGDTEDVEAVLRRLRGLRAWGFPDPRRAARFFPGPGWSVTVEKSGGNPPVTLHAAPADSGWIYTRVDGESRYVMVDSTARKVFAADVESLRDRHLLHFDPQACAGLSISTPDTSVTLTREGGAWSQPNPAFPAPDPERVATLVAGLLRLRFASVLGPATDPWPADETRFEVVVDDERGNLLDEFRCRRNPSGGYEVMGTSLGLRARVDGEEMERLEHLIRRLRKP
jgi:hypothetical protein